MNGASRSPPPEASRVRGWMDTDFRLSGGTVPSADRPPAAAHGDIHPLRVIMTTDGPRLTDWTFPIRATEPLDHVIFGPNRWHIVTFRQAIERTTEGEHSC
jgi:hypothetical protein